jgi:broad specificity phosphatase PhoE
MLIKLVRHGESQADVGKKNPLRFGDHTIGLSEKGKRQAREAGQRIGADFLKGALVYHSPFRRAVETLDALLEGAGIPEEAVRTYEDPRLREVDQGYSNWADVQPPRKLDGWFYYHFDGGESPADCYDRTSGFIDSLMRQAERKQAERALVVTHGLTIRCFVMCFLHLTVAQFNQMSSPANCDIITLGPREVIKQPVFSTSRWGVSGLRIRDNS